MASNFSTGLDTYATLIDNVDDVLAAHANDRGDAIENIQIKLGIDSSSVAASIDYFLKHASGAYRTHTHDGSSDDGANIPNASLIQITTAGKVSGAALTLLANIPSGAGEIPDVNKGFPIVLTTDVTGILPVTNGGTGATAAANTADGVVVLNASSQLPAVSAALLTNVPAPADASISQAKLKTAMGEVSVGVGSWTLVTLPGGTYGFYPQTKSSGTYNDNYAVFVWMGTQITTSYVTNMAMIAAGGGTIYAQQRYVTASGTDHWLFLLVDKITKEIIGSYSAPDHPAYGNGGDFDKLPHPFGNYDETKHEIILVDQDTIPELKDQVTEEKSLLTLVNELYKPNMAKEEAYKPLHSGKYLTENNKQIRELVETIPTYIKCRKLSKLTDVEKSEKINKQKVKEQEYKQREDKKKQDKREGINKLKILGLTEDEIKALKD